MKIPQIALAVTAFVLGIVVARSELWSEAFAQTTEPSRFPAAIGGLAEGQDTPPTGQWLLAARDDEERFRRLQIYAGGTDQQMWQVGYRYEQVHQAIIDGNWALGTHHWGKLRDVFNVALMKRPNRTPNAEDLFLNNTWQTLSDALAAEDPAAARAAFAQQREACMSCHEAEAFGFINGTPMFAETAAFP
jgi:hypothetical protein